MATLRSRTFLAILLCFSASLTALGQSASKPNILFIMGDDIGWMQPSIYHRGLMVGRNPQHRPHRQRRRALHGLLRRAELHLRPQRLLHRHAPAAHRHDPAAAARQPVVSAARHAGSRQVPARPRLQHRRVRQESPGRPCGRAADRARLPGILGIPVSPRRHAAGELPRHQLVSDRARHRAALQGRSGQRAARRAGRRGSENHELPDAAASGDALHILRRHGSESDLQGRGPADAGALQDRGRGDLLPRRRLPRPQRPEEDQQALLRLVQPGAHAHHDRVVRQVPGHGRDDRAARTGASTKPA